jgi:hypothetical protein
MLWLGAAERQAIARLRAKAEASPIAPGAVAAQHARRCRGEGMLLPVPFTIALPDGFRVAFTIEERPSGPQGYPVTERHLVICGAGHPAQVAMLLAEFGFMNDWRDLPVWLEPAGGGRGRAVNIVEALPPPVELEMLVAPPEDGEEVEDLEEEEAA